MGRACTICHHPERDEIDAAIVAGTVNREIACKFRIGRMAIERHALNHLSQAIKEVRQEQSAQAGSTALRRMSLGEEVIEEIIDYSWSSKQKMPELALKALAELRRHVELRAKLEGELDERSITITAIPEWRELRALLLDVLSSHPQAKMAVMRALEAYDVQSA